MEKVVKYCQIHMTHPWYLWKAEFVLLTMIKEKDGLKKKKKIRIVIVLDRHIDKIVSDPNVSRP